MTDAATDGESREPWMAEPIAARILTAALNEGRAAELFCALSDGGAATVDPTGALCIIDADTLSAFDTGGPT